LIFGSSFLRSRTDNQIVVEGCKMAGFYSKILAKMYKCQLVGGPRQELRIIAGTCSATLEVMGHAAMPRHFPVRKGPEDGQAIRQ
jgi:hypothetical protein